MGRNVHSNGTFFRVLTVAQFYRTPLPSCNASGAVFRVAVVLGREIVVERGHDHILARCCCGGCLISCTREDCEHRQGVVQTGADTD